MLRYNKNGFVYARTIRWKGLISLENRNYERAKTKSILVSLSNQNQQITGFLRDVSEGGLKIQRISAGRKIEQCDYDCQFTLPNYGKICTKVAVLGIGDSNEKFGPALIRVQFCDLDPQMQEKIKLYVHQSRSQDDLPLPASDRSIWSILIFTFFCEIPR